MKRGRNNMAYLHIVLPLLAGALIYVYLSPQVYFVKCLPQQIISVSIPVSIPVSMPGGLTKRYEFLKVIRNYLPDMLWGYALVFALFRIFGNNRADIKTVFGIAFIFSACMELLQLSSGVKGTFDVLDIVAMCAAELFAVFIIKTT